MNIVNVKVENVDAIWPHVAPLLLKCFEKAPGYLTPGELWQMCRSGHAFLLIAHEGEALAGASVWCFETTFGQHSFVCKALAGANLDQWVKPIFDAARVMAKQGGATAITATGRVGLQKTLKRNLPGLKVARQTYLVEV